MSIPFDINGGLKLCDEQGRTVGVVLANQAFQDLTAGNERLKAKRGERFRTVVAEREQKDSGTDYVAASEEVAGVSVRRNWRTSNKNRRLVWTGSSRQLVKYLKP